MTYTQKLKGATLHVRVTSDPEADQRKIYEALTLIHSTLTKNNECLTEQ